MRCHTIPQPRNSEFFGREEILRVVDEAFEAQSSRVGSVALWGTGGIGKTQLALEFAHRRWPENTDVVLWISTETAADIAKSFNDAAKALDLDTDVERNTPDKNRDQVLQWIQKTDTPWLMVFDNVETHESLVQNLPRVGNGQILVTCRSGILADSDAITTSVEVPTFTVAESTNMILHILNKQGASEEEIQATSEISKRLGGLALAVDIIARRIKTSRRFKSIEDFLPYLEPNQSSILGRPKPAGLDVSDPKDLERVWSSVFESLNDDATEILRLICFMGPESIPKALFQIEGLDKSCNAGELLMDTNRVQDAKAELFDSSIVRIDATTGNMTIHRLLQNAYFEQMDPDTRVLSFQKALMLLRAQFPSESLNGHSYAKWALCNTWHHHVLALKSRYESMKQLQGFTTRDPAYVSLIRQDAWYMLEIQHFDAAESSLKSLLSEQDPESITTARIRQSLVSVFERTGRSVKAVESARICLDIFLKHDAPKDNNLANMYSNMGYVLVTAYRAAESLHFLDTAVNMAKSWSEPDCHEKFTIDRFLRNRGRAKQQLGQFEDAIRDLEEAEYFQAKTYGPRSHYEGETKHELSKIAAWQGKLDVAYELAKEGLELVSVGKPNHASVMAAQYRLGWIAMLLEKFDLSLEHLQKALVIAQLNEQQRGNSGESARVRWRISQVYWKTGRIEDAKTFYDGAVCVKKDLLASGEYATPEDEEGSWDALVGLLYR